MSRLRYGCAAIRSRIAHTRCPMPLHPHLSTSPATTSLAPRSFALLCPSCQQNIPDTGRHLSAKEAARCLGWSYPSSFHCRLARLTVAATSSVIGGERALLLDGRRVEGSTWRFSQAACLGLLAYAFGDSRYLLTDDPNAEQLTCRCGTTVGVNPSDWIRASAASRLLSLSYPSTFGRFRSRLCEVRTIALTNDESLTISVVPALGGLMIGNTDWIFNRRLCMIEALA